MEHDEKDEATLLDRLGESKPPRRSLIKGAAWSLPVVAVATAAPMVAASPVAPGLVSFTMCTRPAKDQTNKAQSTVVIPAHATNITYQVAGGAGGFGSGRWGGSTGMISGSLPDTVAGQTLTLIGGAGGLNAGRLSNTGSVSAGWPQPRVGQGGQGYGNGGTAPEPAAVNTAAGVVWARYGGGGGGGASALLVGGTPVIVAGGGGGGGSAAGTHVAWPYDNPRAVTSTSLPVKEAEAAGGHARGGSQPTAAGQRQPTPAPAAQQGEDQGWRWNSIADGSFRGSFVAYGGYPGVEDTTTSGAGGAAPEILSATTLTSQAGKAGSGANGGDGVGWTASGSADGPQSFSGSSGAGGGGYAGGGSGSACSAISTLADSWVSGAAAGGGAGSSYIAPGYPGVVSAGAVGGGTAPTYLPNGMPGWVQISFEAPQAEIDALIKDGNYFEGTCA